MVQTAPKLPMQRGSYICKYRCEENENEKEESNTDRSYGSRKLLAEPMEKGTRWEKLESN